MLTNCYYDGEIRRANWKNSTTENRWVPLQIDTKEVTTSRRLVIDADVLITKKNKILCFFFLVPTTESTSIKELRNTFNEHGPFV